MSTAQYVMKARLSVAPFSNISWSSYGAPDETGVKSGYYGTLEGITVDYTLVDGVVYPGTAVIVNQAPAPMWIDPGGEVPLNKQRVMSAGPCKFYSTVGENEGDADVWLMWFDASELPPSGSAPFLVFKVAAGQAFSWEYPRPRALYQGLVWAASSTPGSLSLDTDASFRVHAEVG